MKYFLIKTGVFLIPLVIWILSLILVDPFNYFKTYSIIEDDIKKSTISRSLVKSNEWALWKLLEYKHLGGENIILGDSRIAAIDVNEIQQKTNSPYFNFGIPGLDVQSICDIFWHITKKNKIKNIYIGVSFHYFRQGYNPQIFKSVLDYSIQPFNYLTSIWVNECAIDNITRKYFHKQNSSNGQNTAITIIDFEDLNDEQKAVYKNFKPNINYYPEFEKIISYCEAKDIKLYFIVFPEYKNILNAIKKNNLLPYYDEFINFFNNNGNLYNFNNQKQITDYIENFVDPFHSNSKINKSIIENIWEKKKSQ